MEIINDSGCSPGWFWSIVPPHKTSGTFVLKGSFQLKPGAPAVPVEEPDTLTGDTYVDDDDKRSMVYGSDFSWFKPNCDLLLKGTAYPPGGKPTDVIRVEFGVGSWNKTLAVIGDRVWKPGFLSSSMSDPLLIESMPVLWERAFGGPSYRKNPVGKGHEETVEKDGTRYQALPNIEDPKNLITRRGAKPDPAGFGPYPQTSPQRMRNLGTYNKKWLKENWPGFPDDFDWLFFNAAPKDQQIPGFLKGDEKIRLVNLDPKHSVLESALPGLRPRWFLRDKPEETIRFREIELRLDTVHVDSDRGIVNVVWRGVIDVRTPKMKEFVEQWIVMEPLSENPKAASHYNSAWDKRKKEMEAEEAEADEAIEIEDVAPLDLPDVKFDWQKKLDAEVNGLKADAAAVKNQMAGKEKDLARTFKEAGLDPKKATLKGSDYDPKAAAARIAAQFAFLKSLKPKFKIPKLNFDPDGDPAVQELDAGEAGDEPIDVDDPSEPVDGPPDWTRELVAAHAENKGSFDEQDLSDLDLSEMDLSGLSFQQAVLSRVNLSKANLEQSDLRGAAVEEADLRDARLAKAVLIGADLNKSILSGASLNGAVLDQADLSDAKLDGADLRGLSGKAASGVGVDLSRSNGQKSDWTGADLSGCRMEDADFTEAVLAECSIEGAQAARVVLSSANLAKLNASSGAEFPGGKFRDILAPESCWDGANLDGADLFGALLTDSGFEEASLKKAVLSRAVLRCACLADARLDLADLIEADLFQASLEGASLKGAVFQSANLFEAEFLAADTEGAVFTDANLKRTKLA